MDTQLVLDVTHVDTTITLVVDEHRQATSVLGALLRASQHEVDVRVAIGDETLHTVQTPAVLLLVEGSLQHHALQVTTSIRLRQVHRHTLTCTNAGDILLALFLRTEFIQGVDTALQTPDVLESGISSRNHLAQHREDGVRQVQTAVTTGH